MQEVRGLESDPFSDRFKAGHVIHGTEGFIAEGSLFSPDGELVRTFDNPQQNHFANFIGAVRSGNREDLAADILEGHQSSALCHLGNISHRLGERQSVTDVRSQLKRAAVGDEAMQ